MPARPFEPPPSSQNPQRRIVHVTIVARREATGGKKGRIDPHAAPPTEQYLPARYNSKTELKADVPMEGSETADFALESKGK